jgi:hypothetical protein
MSGFVAYTWNDRDNTIELLLKRGGIAQDLSAVTRMVLQDVEGEWEVDEAVSASAFTRSASVTGKVTVALGDQDIAAGRYNVILIVYDADNTNGLVWDRRGFILQVADPITVD